jgi:hypothetical protein
MHRAPRLHRFRRLGQAEAPSVRGADPSLYPGGVGQTGIGSSAGMPGRDEERAEWHNALSASLAGRSHVALAGGAYLGKSSG